MSDPTPTLRERRDDAPAGYRLGDPIALQDLLALPPDGSRYVRDARGRLALMSPDSHVNHRRPLSRVVRWLNRRLDAHEVIQEPSIALPEIWSRAGRPVPESRLGPKSIEPDVGVFSTTPPPHPQRDVALPAGLLLVVEVLSRRTYRGDLGIGKADAVDRWRTYLASGVPEYWVANFGCDRGPLPPRSGLFLRNEGGVWRPLEGDGLQQVATYRDLPVVAAGVLRSAAVPGLELDLEALWADAAA